MTTDVLVIGGGLAGATAAIRLARGGASVTLLERERTPAHKVCGEFLSSEALFYLRQLGMDLPAMGAVPLHSVRLAGHGCVVERALPFAAMSLTRLRLDAELLQQAESSGVRVRRACPVERLARDGSTWRARLADGEDVLAGTVFLASGKHDVRGHPRPAGKQRGMVAFKMYWRLQAGQMRALGQAVELYTYPGGYAGLQPVEDGLANLCCLIHADELRRAGGNWQGVLAHMRRASLPLQERLRGAEPQLAKPLTVTSLPYGFVRACTEGLWYIGDQAAVIPSFTGDGMSLAVHTGTLAADMYLRGHSAQAYQHTVAAQARRQVALATAVSKTMVGMPRLALWLPRIWPGAVTVLARQTRVDPRFWEHR